MAGFDRWEERYILVEEGPKMPSDYVELPNPFSNSLEDIPGYDHFYPEIAAAGRLSLAVAHQLRALGSPLAAQDDVLSPYCATFSEKRRTANVNVARTERLFLVHFWRNGVKMCDLSTPNLDELAQSLKLWLLDRLDLRSMEARVRDLRIAEMAYEYEAGRGVEAQWNLLLSSQMADSMGPMLPLVQAAASQPLLRQLFPIYEIWALHFSRTTGEPHTADLPFAVVTGKGNLWEVPKNPSYRAYKPDGTFIGQGTPETLLGEGTPQQVIQIIVESLPPGIGPAIDGTADDLI